MGLWNDKVPTDIASVDRVIVWNAQNVRDGRLRNREDPRHVTGIYGMGIGYSWRMSDGRLRDVKGPRYVASVYRVVCAIGCGPRERDYESVAGRDIVQQCLCVVGSENRTVSEAVPASALATVNATRPSASVWSRTVRSFPSPLAEK